MEWSDILVKIGVGACMGFGIIVLAKLGKKKNEQQNRADSPERSIKENVSDRR